MNNKLNNNFSLRKLLLTALVAGPLATLPAPLWALPDTASTNLTTSAGVTTQVVGSTLNVTSPDKAVLTWQVFGNTGSTINNGEVINYFLPSPSSSVLNSVSGGGTTTISGSIISNGNVYVLNPAGIVISPTAQVNTGGFYASTVAEPSGFFGINGTLSFAGTSTANVIVQGTGTTSGTDAATIQAVGSGNNIYLVGNAVDIQGGKFFGNLFVRSSSTANPLAGVSTQIGSTGPVSVNLVGTPLVGGGLNIATNGGNARLTGATGTLTIAPSVSGTTGAVVVNTSGQSVNGSISQGAAAFTASTSGAVVTLNAGTGTTGGNITLANVDFLTVGSTGNNIALTDTNNGITLQSTNAAGTLAVTTGPTPNTQTSTGSILTATGATHTVGGSISLAPVAGSTVSFTGTGNLTFAAIGTTSTLTVVSTGDITLPALTTTSTMTLTSSGGQITATNITSSTLNITASSSAGNITVNGAVQSNTTSITTVGNINITGSLRISNGTSNVTASGGSITLGSLTSSSTVNVTASAGSITAGAISASANPLVITANNGTVTATGATAATNSLTVSGGTISMGAISTNSALTLTASTGTISLTSLSTSSTATISAPSSNGTISFTGTITSTTSNVAGSNTLRPVTLTSGGSITVPTTSAPLLNVTSTTGSISQSGAITSATTGTAGSTATFTAAGDIALSNVANDFTNLSLKGGASASSGATVSDANGVVLTTGNYAGVTSVTTTAGSITLGAASIDVLGFGNTLTLTANGAGGSIGTNANNVTAFGNVSLNTVGSASLGSNIFGNAANYQFGQIQGTVTGALNVTENTTLNLGKITAGSLDARSLSGEIINTGALTVTGSVIVAANSIFSPGNVTLNNTGNVLSGTVFIGNAKDFALTNTVNTTVTAGTALVNGKAVTGSATVTVTGAGRTLTMNTGVGGDYTNVGFNASGNVSVTDANGFTLQNATNTGSGTVLLTTGVGGNGPIVLGSGIALGSTGLTTVTSTGLTAGISDSAPNVRIFGPVNFTSDNSISITNSGHSLGAVGLVTTAANGVNGTSNVTYTEGGTANLANVSVGSGAFPGSLTVVSTGGNVQQAVGGTITALNTVIASNVSFTSSTGSVTLGNAGNTFTSAVAISAVGNSSINVSTIASPLTLNNVVVSAGTFAATAGNAAGNTISQLAGSSAKIFGNSSFTTQGNKITLTNTGNNFGGVTLDSTNVGAAALGADVAITEAGTLNFLSVKSGTNGKLAATSEKASIIQSGTAGLIVGGTTALTAADAGIALNTATTSNTFGGANGITITTAGNVSIQDANATTTIAGGTTIGGTLTVKNTQGSGKIQDSPGNLTVNGNVLFDTTTNAASSVSIGSSNATLGAIQFRSGAVTIVENATLNIAAGSVASGAVSLTSSGNIVTSGSGGGTFQSTLALNASGTITITNPIFVNGAGGSGLTFRSLSAVDLSALSLAGNLNSIAPTNLGASSYKAPSP